MAYTQEQIEKIQAEAVEYKQWFADIEEMIKKLEILKERGLNFFYNFNGQKCYALLDDADSCYKKITGMTRSEYKEEQRKWHEEYERREAEAKQKASESIPGWIAEGKGMIYPQRHEEWEKCVNIRANDLYHGLDLVGTLEVMKHLENGGSLADAKKMIDETNCDAIMNDGDTSWVFSAELSVYPCASNRGIATVYLNDVAVTWT